MAYQVLYEPLHLIQSALGQKVKAKPAGSSCRERSQGRPVMGGHEVASLAGEMGSPLGRSCGRASPLRAKSGRSATLNWTGLVAVNAVSGAPTTPALPAITSHTWNVCFTDEVPRRPGPQGLVIVGYKPDAKSQRHAPVTGTASLRPRLQGCQQRQSRGPGGPGSERLGSERQNLCMSGKLLGFRGPVSPGIEAPKWPGGTSSCQPPGSLRNRSKQPRAAGTTVGSG